MWYVMGSGRCYMMNLWNVTNLNTGDSMKLSGLTPPPKKKCCASLGKGKLLWFEVIRTDLKETVETFVVWRMDEKESAK